MIRIVDRLGVAAVLLALGCGEPARTPDAVDDLRGTSEGEEAPPSEGMVPVDPQHAGAGGGAGTAADMKTLVNAIARAAHAAFEREGAEIAAPAGKGPTRVVHALCLSAKPVPAEVPKGTSYTPTEADFGGDDATKGWHCLNFDVTEPLYCQITYAAGRGYKSLARGNKALKEDPPGKPATSYEAAAECDFDGDGETSLYARTQTVDPKFSQLGTPQDFFDKDGE